MNKFIGLILALSIPGIIGAHDQGTEDYPILSEFLCNPTGELETEWIELYNPRPDPVLISNLKIGDALGLRDISDTVLYLDPGQYIILAADPDRFRSYYAGFSGTIIEPIGWQALNNYGEEVVRLADAGGKVIDSVCYEDGFPDNRSYERYVDYDGNSFWGGSFAPEGSTPGKENTFYAPRGSSIVIQVEPDPFSPDGDGFEDITYIDYDLPEADCFDLCLYDVSGRKVKTLRDSAPTIPGRIEWDGTDDDGRKLPVGIYIIFARIEGAKVGETKKTVVIAR